jgi:hypothetical protein
VKQHGEDAAIIAASRADALLVRGDLEGYWIWKRIFYTVEHLLSSGFTGVAN